MPDFATPLPARRPDLVLRPIGDEGEWVVKDPATGDYYQLGPAEYFLLGQLDGKQDSRAVRAAFAERFGQPLSEDELREFVATAEAQGFLQAGPGAAPVGRPADAGPATPERQSLLHWRKSLFDPDRLFTWLAPRLWFFWTGAFLAISAGCILLAAALVWANRHGVAGSFAHALRWETAALVWLTLLLVTTLHEFAHGLTCKHYGGEVHEIGFLLLFLMPAFYCNVSDAWLFREKSKRLWVTFAGGYFELFLWALAVFAWRLTLPGTLIHYLAFVVLSVCGIQTLFNFNPLLKLDGYYLLSDWLGIPNLRQRALDCLQVRLRRLLWGAPPPEREARGRVLLVFGLASWLYSLAFLALSLVVLTHFLGARLGLLGLAAVVCLGLLTLRGLFHGFTAGEVRKMILLRHKRTAVWTLLLVGMPVALFLIPMQDRASGPFQLRPTIRVELRAPVAGFLKEISCDEGDRVAPGALLVRLEVPDLASRIAQKRAEVREVQAKLRLLETGPRYEEIVQQRRRVERAEAWGDLARQDLERARKALAEDLKRLGEQIIQYRAEVENAQKALTRAQQLRSLNALSIEEHAEAVKKCKVFKAQLEQAQAQQRARQALGVQEAEAEWARRAKDLADAQATLTLLEAGTRPEEIEAERARLARLQEEARYLEQHRDKLSVHSPVAGSVTTPRLKEKVGQYVREGDLICVVEELAGMEVEITLAEQDVARVCPGQAAVLRVRALPFETLETHVDRIAPAAGHGDVQSTVTVYCRLDDCPPGLRPGMTGYGRVYTGPRPVGRVLLDRALRWLRTECWWW
jgi:multidrug efflux pump subunit AcrA (membrane-fusion protein)